MSEKTSEGAGEGESHLQLRRRDLAIANFMD